MKIAEQCRGKIIPVALFAILCSFLEQLKNVQ